MTPTESVFQFLDTLGFWDVILPFMFVFTVVYAMAVKSNVFGKTRQNIAMLVSFCVAFFFVASLQMVEGLSLFLPWLVVFILSGFFSMFIFSALGGDTIGSKMKTLLMFGALLIVAGVALYAFGGWDLVVGWDIAWGLVITGVVFGVVMWFIIRPVGKSKPVEKKSSTPKESDGDFYKRYPDAVKVPGAEPVERISRDQAEGTQELYNAKQP